MSIALCIMSTRRASGSSAKLQTVYDQLDFQPYRKFDTLALVTGARPWMLHRRGLGRLEQSLMRRLKKDRFDASHITRLVYATMQRRVGEGRDGDGGHALSAGSDLLQIMNPNMQNLGPLSHYRRYGRYLGRMGAMEYLGTFCREHLHNIHPVWINQHGAP